MQFTPEGLVIKQNTLRNLHVWMGWHDDVISLNWSQLMIGLVEADLIDPHHEISIP